MRQFLLKKFWLLCKSKFLFLVQQNWTFEFSVKAIQSDSNVFLIQTPLQKQYINNDLTKKNLTFFLPGNSIHRHHIIFIQEAQGEYFWCKLWVIFRIEGRELHPSLSTIFCLQLIFCLVCVTRFDFGTSTRRLLTRKLRQLLHK